MNSRDFRDLRDLGHLVNLGGFGSALVALREEYSFHSLREAYYLGCFSLTLSLALSLAFQPKPLKNHLKTSEKKREN